MFSLLSKTCQLSKRALRIIRPSRELFTFLVFLVLSGIFWLSSTLNDYYDREILIPVVIENPPKNVVLSSNGEDTVRVMVRDKGYTILNYLYGTRAQQLTLNFPSYIRTDGKAVVSTNELHKLIKQQLYASSVVASIKPDRLEYGYTKGVPKSVPVRLQGKIVPAENYYVAQSLTIPQNVTVYSTQTLLDSIKYVATTDVDVQNFTDTLEFEVGLKPISGAKISPNTVKVKIFPDVLTEESVEVPITAVNVPEGLQLRMFPARVKVLFNVGMSQFRNINTSQFVVVADYNKIEEGSDHCPIRIARLPMGITKAKTEIDQVDYLIEN